MTTDARLEPPATEPVPTAEEAARGEPVEGDSAKLLRITVMVHEMLEEVRHMPLDEGGRRRLRVIHEATVKELRHLLPETLRHELDAITLPLGDTATESEVRLAQIQLLGWLEGLMHGIQAALWAKVAHNLSHAQNRVVAKAAEGSDTGQYL